MKYTKKEIKKGINIHIINTARFKTNLVAVFLSTPITREEVTYNAVISSVLRRGSKQVNFERYVPYATGKKRYLINRENQHITGAPFVSPIKTKGYYVETHKSKMGAVNDMYHFLEKIGVRVEYIM